MRVQHIGYRIRGFYRVAALGHLWDMTPKDAHRRLEILRFFDKHGLAATRDAFGVSRRRSTAGRPPSKPKAATRLPWQRSPARPKSAEPPRPTPGW
jgi:hypothetical protein